MALSRRSFSWENGRLGGAVTAEARATNHISPVISKITAINQRVEMRSGGGETVAEKLRHKNMIYLLFHFLSRKEEKKKGRNGIAYRSSCSEEKREMQPLVYGENVISK